MTDKTLELRREQKYFDRALEERKRKVRVLRAAPGAAAGPGKGAGQIKRITDQAIESFGDPDDPVAFGRFDTDEGEAYYLGKHVITTQDQDVLVINWKTKAAEPYYRANIVDRCAVRRKRTYSTKGNQVLDFEDTVLVPRQLRL